MEIDRRVFELYDEYCHGRIDRREFLARAGALTVAGVSALAMAQALLPRYAQAQTISFTDERMRAQYVNYPSPGGNSGSLRGYLARPAGQGPFPSVLVIHENRGLNPYIEDVARRAAVEGFLALAPDGLFPVGGYPGNDDDGRTLQAGLDQSKLRTDMLNSALSEIACAVDRQAWRDGFLLGRQYHQLPRRQSRRRSESSRPLLWCGGRGPCWRRDPSIVRFGSTCRPDPGRGSAGPCRGWKAPYSRRSGRSGRRSWRRFRRLCPSLRARDACRLPVLHVS